MTLIAFKGRCWTCGHDHDRHEQVFTLSALDLDAMDVQPLLLAVQNWDISTGRARELLRCWALGTFKPDMLPPCGDDLFDEATEPREAWAALKSAQERKPLTDEQINMVTATERDNLLDHICEYGTVAEGIIERLHKFARAIEAAHGIFAPKEQK